MEHVLALAAALSMEVDVEAEDFDQDVFMIAVLANIEVERASYEEMIAGALSQLDGVAAQLESVNSENEEMKAQLEEITVEAERLEADRKLSVIDAAISSGALAESQRDWATENFEAFEALAPTLEGNPQGPPQGEDTKVTPDVADFPTLEGKERVEFIRKHATENEISFEAAFIALNE